MLSEINTIGQTTTYNSSQVFTGSAAGVNIYTGDSSTTGSAIDNLYFASLSSSTVGDSGGTVVQSSAGVFYDLSKDTTGALTTAAQSTDTIAGGLKFTVTNADGTTTNFTTTATTLSGLVQEINKDGIPGVTASLTTANAVGDTAVNANDTGILLSNTNSSVAIANGATALSDTTTGGTVSTFNSTKATETISYQRGTTESTTNLSATDLCVVQVVLCRQSGEVIQYAKRHG